MTVLAKVLTAFVGLFFAAMWVQIQFTPDAAATQLAVLLGDKDPAAMATFRADVGGLFLSAAVFTVLGLLGQRHFLIAAAITMAAAIAGRLLGIVIDGAVQTSTMAIVAEVVFIGVLLFAHRQLAADNAS